MHPVTNAMIKSLAYFCLCPPKTGGQIQAIRIAGDHCLCKVPEMALTASSMLNFPEFKTIS